MKRDMDVVRELLMLVESIPAGKWDVENILQIDGISDTELIEYINILSEAKYIDASLTHLGGGSLINTVRLTWEGHELLEAIRSDTVWEETKEVVQKTGGGMVISVLKSVATKLITDLAMGQIT